MSALRSDMSVPRLTRQRGGVTTPAWASTNPRPSSPPPEACHAFGEALQASDCTEGSQALRGRLRFLTARMRPCGHADVSLEEKQGPFSMVVFDGEALEVPILVDLQIHLRRRGDAVHEVLALTSQGEFDVAHLRALGLHLNLHQGERANEFLGPQFPTLHFHPDGMVQRSPAQAREVVGPALVRNLHRAFHVVPPSAKGRSSHPRDAASPAGDAQHTILRPGCEQQGDRLPHPHLPAPPRAESSPVPLRFPRSTAAASWLLTRTESPRVLNESSVCWVTLLAWPPVPALSRSMAGVVVFPGIRCAQPAGRGNG
ncbi:hypothetical protein STIAU_8342 [Stigmatella aurantiaca DW4/3-1]|uniref:Uncharacterized protein n=1 Tax=Stigmatella aurantiaca (strain DW4/3-1) TaxID=378806 RepID=Q09EA0_STIAD|nr:hypothetical protein STIAU_8342 [Stigmatella aurantiaca DW4/3-1]